MQVPEPREQYCFTSSCSRRRHVPRDSDEELVMYLCDDLGEGTLGAM
jgi:hypothetical protein